jgi:hypothetical protein
LPVLAAPPLRRSRQGAHPRVPAPVQAPVPALPAPIPAPETFRLSTGLTCLLVESHERPLIRMELVCRWDRAELPAGKEGIAGFLAETMDSGGAGPETRAGFLRALDSLGLVYRFQPRMGSFHWSLTADSRSQESAMERLVDAVARPTFDGPLVEVVRQGARKRSAAASPRARAAARFRWQLQAPDALTPPGPLPYERIEFQDLLDFQRRVVRPEHTTLALYGDLNLAQARQLALLHFGVWGPSPQPPVMGVPPAPGAVPAAAPKLLAVLDSGPSVELWAGAPRPPDPGAPEVTALLPILLARSALAVPGAVALDFQMAPDVQGPLIIRARVPQADRDRLVPGLVKALEGLRARGCTGDDLACARFQWRAGNAALPLHPEALLRGFTDGRLDPGLAQAMDRLTPGQMTQAVQAWLDPGRLRYLLLGADAAMLQAVARAGLGPAVQAGME